MRKRLNILVLAVTSLVVIAFTVPLGLLVRQQADERARAAAERQVQSVAADVVREVVAASGNVEPATLSSRLLPLPANVSLLLPDGSIVGEAEAGSEVTRQAAQRGGSFNAYTDEGWELALPVLTRSGSVIVWAAVPESQLRQGVQDAQLLLGMLGVGLIVISLGVASRLGRSLTEPVTDLAEAASALAEGDLGTRVAVDDPPEFAAVADAFNQMAPRLQELIDLEREEVADLSHRLRTPLTSVRLQAEAIVDPDQRVSLLAQVDRLQQAVDELIAEARRRPVEGAPASDLNSVVTRRVAFWSVLAEEQEREFTVHLSDEPLPVAVSDAEMGAALDALIGNVFVHSPQGSSMEILTASTEGSALLTVGDAGPGFAVGLDPLERGVSSAGSSGLGLDIVGRLAERLGGSIELGRSDLGGAAVVVQVPLASD